MFGNQEKVAWEIGSSGELQCGQVGITHPPNVTVILALFLKLPADHVYPGISTLSEKVQYHVCK
jgi:hypothetical protein